MRFTRWKLIAVAMLTAVLAVPSAAEIVYTPVNARIALNTPYSIDLDANGVTDFTLTAKFVQGLCQQGDEYEWALTVAPAGQNGVVIDASNSGSNDAAPLANGVLVNSSQRFSSNLSLLAELYWGACGTGTLGEWLGFSGRYLGVAFQGSDGLTHYGWAEVSTSAYVDQNGHLQTTTILMGFAYETVAGQGILTGQTTGP
jgi:hypothetical protein